MTQVIFTDVSALTEEEFYNVYDAVCEERRKRADALRFWSDKKLCIGAGYLLKIALQQFSLHERDVKIQYGENGKPYISSANAQFNFNLSHSGSVAVCAFSEGEVGADVQQIVSVGQNVMGRICTESEYRYLMQCDEKKRQSEFFRLWTAKESVMKFCGKGLSLPIDDIGLSLDADPHASIRGTGRLYLKEYSIDDYLMPTGTAQYKLTVCSESNDFAPSAQMVEIP